MTYDRPIKLSVLVILSVPQEDGSLTKATSEDISNLIPINRRNLQQYLLEWERQEVIRRGNPGSRPVQWELSEKGKQELVMCGRRR